MIKALMDEQPQMHRKNKITSNNNKYKTLLQYLNLNEPLH